MEPVGRCLGLRRAGAGERRAGDGVVVQAGGPPSPADEQAEPGDQRDDEDHDRDEHEFHAASLPAHSGDAGGTQVAWVSLVPCRPDDRARPPPRSAPAARRPGLGDRVGRDRPRPARSRCSAGGRARSASAATTTRSSWSRASSPGSSTPYEVRLDGGRVWPPAGSEFPPSRIRTPGRRRPLPHRVRFLPLREPPDGRGGRGHPARRAGPLRQPDRRPAGGRSGPTRWCCSATRSTPTSSPRRRSRWLHPSPARAGSRPRPGGRGGRLRGVHPALRGVLGRSAGPVAAVDDPVVDDLRRPRDDRRLEHLGRLAARGHRARTGGRERISGGLVSYWVYQHLGNLSPQELAENKTWQAIQGLRGRRHRRRRADAAGDGRARRRRAGQHPVELRAALGRRAADHDRQPGRPGARGAAPPDGRRRRVRLGRGGDAPRRRRGRGAPDPRHVAAVAAAARDPQPRAVERDAQRAARRPVAGTAGRDACGRPPTWSTGRPSGTPSSGWAGR